MFIVRTLLICLMLLSSVASYATGCNCVAMDVEMPCHEMDMADSSNVTDEGGCCEVGQCGCNAAMLSSILPSVALSHTRIMFLANYGVYGSALYSIPSERLDSPPKILS